MKRPTQWLFWLLLAKCLLSYPHRARGEFFVLSGPAINRGNLLYTYQTYRDMYCVTDELSSALTWNSNLDWSDKGADINVVGAAEVVNMNDRYVYPANDTLTCQMSTYEPCTRNWRRAGSWNVTYSPTAPIFDNRWNDFTTEKLTDRFERKFHVADIGSLSISVRGASDAHFALCTDDVSSSFCFFIILGGWKNTRAVIRKCEKGVPDPVTNYPTGGCNVPIADKTNVTLLSATEWRTFLIKWNFQTEVSLAVYSTDAKLLEYQEKLNNHGAQHGQHYKSYFQSSNYNFYARSGSSMLIKFHFFNYLRSTTTKSKLTSPPIMTASPDRTMCLEMSIYQCDKCVLTVDFVDRNGTMKAAATFVNRATANHYDLPAWRTVKIRKKLPADMVEPITLSINTLLTNNTSRNNTYWAVSNIRRCHDGALKVIKIQAYQDYKQNYFWPVVTCQKISADGSSMIIDSSNRTNTNLNAAMRPLCLEGKVGPSCLTSCSRLFEGNADCRHLVACDRYGCSCAQGFKLPGCDNSCPASSYGFECTQRCGNCTDGECSPLTGKCLHGCESSPSRFFVPPYCKIGVGSPPAPNVDVQNSSCARITLDVIDNYKIVPTRINFRVHTNGYSLVGETEPIVVRNDTYHIETYAEHLSPGTHYNVTAVVHAGDRTFIGEPAHFTTSCTESVSLNFVVQYNETSLTLDNRVDVNVNDSCPYSWYRVQLSSGEGKLFDGPTHFPRTFGDLEAATLYRLTVTTEKITIVNRLITTLDGVPSSVKNLQAVARSGSEIQFAWQPPEKTNGKVTNYTAEIKPIESMGCVDLGASYQNSSNLRNSENLKMQIVVTNNSLYEYRASFQNLHPYTRYLIVVYASTSRHAGEKAEIHHKTSSKDTPTEVFTNLRLTNETSETVAGYLRWDPPSDCSAITGPIKAAKLFVRQLNGNFSSVETIEYYHPLDKSLFEGTVTYEARLHTLRYVNSKENETAFTSLTFRMPDRAPPSVRNAEIVEVDTRNGTITFRWAAPVPPIHGKLDHFSIQFCKSNIHDCKKDHLIARLNESCELWDLDNAYCKTVPLPALDYGVVQIRAHNENVTEASDPVVQLVLRTELEPTAPKELLLEIIGNENAAIKVTWTQPLTMGDRLAKFLVQIKLITSSLKIQPVKERNVTYNVTDYQRNYTTDLNLSPSSTFLISVKAVTWTGLSGAPIVRKISLPTGTNFSVETVRPIVNDDLTISIVIPEIKHDVNNSMLIVVVQGPKYCDDGLSNNEDIDLLLKTDSSSYYKTAWKAATLTEPERYANKEFRIGDGEIYGGSKNYALCSLESYIVYLVLIEDPSLLKEYRSIGRNTLQSVKTSAISIGEVPRNYAVWLAPVFFIVLILAMIALLIYRKKLSSHFLKDDLSSSKSPSNHQENMPLSNDFTTKQKKKSSANLIEETDSVIKVKEMPNNLFIVEKKPVEFEKPIGVEEFGNYFESAYKSGQLRKEYTTIRSLPTMPCTYGSQTETKPKNRYANLFPYDDTRVILEKLPDVPYSDYINANYITGYGGKAKAYIATQGPKPNTVIDFWRMVWQEKVRIVCMMANLEENGKTKCEQYWPAGVGKRMLYGQVSVQFASEEVHSDYTYRTFRVGCCGGGGGTSEEKTRTIEQLHYTAWPDHGVPSNPRSIVAFLNEMQRHAPCPRGENQPPIVVHCSAGVGRTGTLVVLDMSVCRAHSEQVIDVYEDVVSVRKERPNMVDNTEQYLLVHLVLVEYLNSKDTCFACDDEALPRKIAQAKLTSAMQYKRIVDTSWWDEVLGSPPLPEKSLSNRNRAKHRFPESAGGYNRLYLKRLPITDEDSDYIAATCVRGLRAMRSSPSDECIATQLPLPATAADFWRMLAEQSVEFVLVLQTPDLRDPTYCELVPENQGYGSTKYLKIIRQESSTEDSQYYFKEQVLIIDSSEQPSKHQLVTIASYKSWPSSSSSSLPPARELVKLWKTIDALMAASNEQQKNPSVIVCCDGVTACGLWLAASFLLKRMTMDKECDVYQAVRAVRRIRKDFLNKPDYLDYLYDVALAWANDD